MSYKKQWVPSNEQWVKTLLGFGFYSLLSTHCSLLLHTHCFFFWSPWPDSNRWPPPYQGGALTNWATRAVFSGKHPSAASGVKIWASTYHTVRLSSNFYSFLAPGHFPKKTAHLEPPCISSYTKNRPENPLTFCQSLKTYINNFLTAISYKLYAISVVRRTTLERETGFEPATASLEGWNSTAELLPQVFSEKLSSLLHNSNRCVNSPSLYVA